MRIKHNPIIKRKQNVLKSGCSPRVLQPYESNDPLADRNSETVWQESNLKQREQGKSVETANPQGNLCQNVTDERFPTAQIQIIQGENVRYEIKVQSLPHKDANVPNDDIIISSKKSSDGCYESPKSTPFQVDKSAVKLPQLPNSYNNGKSSKPSASVGPYNHVKFETATGKTLYFSKYVKVPPNLPPGKTVNKKKRKRIRTAFTDVHLRVLEEEYAKNRFVNASQRIFIAKHLNLTDRSVKVWFQNRRIKDKRQRMIDPDSDDEECSGVGPAEKAFAQRKFLPTSAFQTNLPNLPTQTFIQNFYHDRTGSCVDNKQSDVSNFSKTCLGLIENHSPKQKRYCNTEKESSDNFPTQDNVKVENELDFDTHGNKHLGFTFDNRNKTGFISRLIFEDGDS